MPVCVTAGGGGGGCSWEIVFKTLNDDNIDEEWFYLCCERREQSWLYQYYINDEDGLLTELLMNGVGVHHAGLEVQDRRLIEELFRGGKLAILSRSTILRL